MSKRNFPKLEVMGPCLVDMKRDRNVAEVFGTGDDVTEWLRLFKASPLMLEALRKVAKAFGPPEQWNDEHGELPETWVMHEVERAIAEAEGRAE